MEILRKRKPENGKILVPPEIIPYQRIPRRKPQTDLATEQVEPPSEEVLKFVEENPTVSETNKSLKYLASLVSELTQFPVTVPSPSLPKKITTWMLLQLTDWLRELCHDFSWTNETLHLSQMILLEFLSKPSDSPPDHKSLQPLGLSCLLIASKLLVTPSHSRKHRTQESRTSSI